MGHVTILIGLVLLMSQCRSTTHSTTLIETIEIHPVEKWQGLFKHAPDQEVRELLTKALNKDPIYDADLLKAASNALAIGQLAFAEELFQRLGKQKEDFNQIESRLGLAQVGLMRRKFENAELVLRGLKEFERITPIQSLRGHYLESMLEYLQGRYEQAQFRFENMISINPQFSPAYSGLARVYLSQGLDDFAQRVLVLGVDRCGHSAEFFHLRGVIELRNNNHEQARSLFERALRLVDTYIPARLAIASMMVDQKQWESAERLVYESLQIEPHHYQARVMHAVIYVRQGRYENAKDLLEEAILFYPASAEARFELGMLMATHYGKKQRALQLFSEVQTMPDADPRLISKARSYAQSLRN